MIEPYLIPANEIRTELLVQNSRFITSIGPAFSVEMARNYIEKIKLEYEDASHHVPAFLIGFGPSTIAHCSDAGEPAGTAGKPVLSILQGSGLGDIVAVVTRYFGGTKLGTGGLVRAYGECVRNALSLMPRAIKIATHLVKMIVPYPLYDKVCILSKKNRIQVIDEDFGADVTITLRIPVGYYDLFRSALAEITAGSVEVMLLETKFDSIIPVET